MSRQIWPTVTNEIYIVHWPIKKKRAELVIKVSMVTVGQLMTWDYTHVLAGIVTLY